MNRLGYAPSSVDAPTERPWAEVAFCPVLLCLGQTTSCVRGQAESSCLLGEENISLSPIPPSLRVNCTHAPHLPTAQQIFRPSIHKTAQRHCESRFTSCHSTAFSREPRPTFPGGNTPNSNVEHHPNFSFRRRTPQFCPNRRQDERRNCADSTRRTCCAVPPHFQSTATQSDTSCAGAQCAKTETPDGGGAEAGCCTRSSGPTKPGSAREKDAQDS